MLSACTLHIHFIIHIHLIIHIYIITHISLDGYCSTVQGLLDWYEVDFGFTKPYLFR